MTTSPYEVVPPRGFTWQIPALLDYWVDGDSFYCHARFSPQHEEHAIEVRIEGINAIELHESYGKEAKEAAERIAPPGLPLLLLSHKREKYGRLLARVILPDTTEIGTRLLLERSADGTTPLAVPYLT